MSKPDLANLKRVIELGSADAARDAGLTNFLVNVTVGPFEPRPVITVDVIVLTPEQAAALAEELKAEHAKREAGN